MLRRAANGLSDTLEINTQDLFQAATPLWNIPIQPADIVNIPVRTVVTVFCLGRGQDPRRHLVRQRGPGHPPLGDRQGGRPPDRASKTIRVKRRGPDGKDVEKTVDFNRILSGKDPDLPLEGNDVVVVKESFF